MERLEHGTVKSIPVCYQLQVEGVAARSILNAG
jgi:hypothetical protein